MAGSPSTHAQPTALLLNSRYAELDAGVLPLTAYQYEPAAYEVPLSPPRDHVYRKTAGTVNGGFDYSGIHNRK